MGKWILDEDEQPESYLENPEALVGDTLEVISNNQMGQKKYEVILNASGEKQLKLISDYDTMMANEFGREDETQKGGRRRRRKSRKSRKGRTTRRRTNKRRYRN